MNKHFLFCCSGIIDRGPGLGAWIAADNDHNPWFQVDLVDFMEVRGIVTQVRSHSYFDTFKWQ